MFLITIDGSVYSNISILLITNKVPPLKVSQITSQSTEIGSVKAECRNVMINLKIYFLSLVRRLRLLPQQEILGVDLGHGQFLEDQPLDNTHHLALQWIQSSKLKEEGFCFIFLVLQKRLISVKKTSPGE